MYALILYFAGNIKCQGGGGWGVGEEEEEEGGNFKFQVCFFSVNTLFNFIFVNKYYELYIEVLVCGN